MMIPEWVFIAAPFVLLAIVVGAIYVMWQQRTSKKETTLYIAASYLGLTRDDLAHLRIIGREPSPEEYIKGIKEEQARLVRVGEGYAVELERRHGNLQSPLLHIARDLESFTKACERGSVSQSDDDSIAKMRRAARRAAGQVGSNPRLAEDLKTWALDVKRWARVAKIQIPLQQNKPKRW